MSRKVFEKKPVLLGLSPMDGVTDCAYREIVKKYSNPDILYTEFQNVHGLSLGVENLFEHFRYTENQRYIVAQIYGHESEYFYPATIICFLLGFDGVDINMGCPAKKISDRGAGAGLIRYPETAKEIINEVKRAREDFENNILPQKPDSKEKLLEILNNLSPYKGFDSWATLKVKWNKILDIIFEKVSLWEVESIVNGNFTKRINSVSVKTRIGYEESTIEQWIMEILSCDIDFLAIHGRTLKQMYTGSANYAEIAKGIAEARKNGIEIPIFANGDIKSVESARNCLEITKADGVLVGRGTYGDMVLIKNIKNSFEGQIIDELNIGNIKQIMIDHCENFVRFKGENQFFQMRKNLGWYINGIDNAVEIRKKLFLTNSTHEVKQILSNL